MCTAFSNIQNLNKAKRDPNVVKAEIDKARLHLAWCCKLYQKQMDREDTFSTNTHVSPPIGRSPRSETSYGKTA